MIEQISVMNVATFHPETPVELSDLRQFNYIFGSNGTGKTTISRVIADAAFCTSSRCTWRNGLRLETLVLNRDFVEKNFDQLRGVFTLGEERIDTKEKIRAAKEESDRQSERLSNLRRSLHGDDANGGKKGDLATLESDSRDKFWLPIEKIKKERKLDGALIGVLANKEKCKEKILHEAQNNKAALKDLADLEKRAETILGETPTKHDPYPTIDDSTLLAHEGNSILGKNVIGKKDVDIAAMITKLENSDWVRQGLSFYKRNDRVCPFCQQQTTEQFEQSLEDYFDEVFERDTSAISTLISGYARDASAIQSTLDGIIAAPGKFIDINKMKTEKAALDKTIEANKLRLANKKKEPSQVVTLDSVKTILDTISAMIDAANVEVVQHNKVVDHLDSEKEKLTAEVWRYVLNELKVDLEQYIRDRDGLDKAIAGLETQIKECERTIEARERTIRELEKQTTSIQPTINAINGTLKEFGFDSFALADAGDGKKYKLIRSNNEDAMRTLSEGEKSFVIFLYFYHLIRGSFSEVGITTDRIVVFDDPVSSLDSDVLFIVSSLIREVCEKCLNDDGHIKQVFVLTHNVYFHKEVTYNNRRRLDGCLKEESFWIVRKNGPHSQCTRHSCNPIKTSYELLWEEVREAEQALQKNDGVNPRIQNTLRRILEHYFGILGLVDYKKVCEKFDGQDKVICNSLFSWVNAGSHSFLDDAHLTPSETMVRNALQVFKKIFVTSDHFAHYHMMMRTAAPPEAAEVEP